MQRLRLVLAVALALLLAGLWWSRKGADTRADPGLVAEPRQSAPAAAPASVPLEVGPTDVREALPREESELVPEEAFGTSDIRPDADRMLSGTIVVVDDLGIEHPNENGSFQFVLWRGDHGPHHEVQVVDGQWTTTIPEETWPELLSLADIVLGRRPAVLIENREVRWPPEHFALRNLRVRWPPVSRLFVRDRATGAEIEDVLLVEAGEWPCSDLAHPGDDAEQAKHCGPSPVLLNPGERNGFGTTVWFASGAGHAWGRIEIDFDRGGDRILALDAGGELDVQIVGVVEDPNLVLRLFQDGYRPIVEMPLDDRHKSVEIRGLVPGEYRVTAQIGDYWSNPLELGLTTATVTAGVRSGAVLTLEPLVRSPPVPLSGTLALPAEWGLEEFALEFELLGTALGGGDGSFRIERSGMQLSEDHVSYRWKAPDAQIGKYEVGISELAFSVMLDVRAPGLTDARIEVPPPAEVTVRCVDDETGAELEGARITWHFKLPEGVESWSMESAAWDATRRCFAFRAPIGRVLIDAQCEDYGWISEEFAIASGDNAFALRLRKLCSLRPILRDGDTVIPITSDLEIMLVAAEGQEDNESWSSSGGAVTLHRVQPGLYTLKIPQIPGYQPVPDATVRLETGRVIEHVVQLVRTH